ncbi:hypothetical protein [Nonlabens sp. MIC269]|uniref:hypothetical protein n=1 Tax=Nonlabens sp. MIC269 TaxID=1476901 RepID=UPI0012FC7F0A|nr:hypothetical protein [Nonlabens sp. MIC269]
MKSQSRNKIIFYKQDILGLEAIDIGKKLSHEINPITSDAKIGMKFLIIMDELFTSSLSNNSEYGKYLAIRNVGILLEPELKTDFIQILDKYSSLNTLFVKWDGEIEDGILYFLTKEKGQKIDIKNLSHIVI